MLQVGSSGAEVTALQEFLLAAGYELPKFGADGDFGSETLAALKSYQEDNGLVADGIVGPKTQAVMDGEATDDTDDTDAEDPNVDEETALTILSSDDMKWYHDTNTGKWYVSYGLPDSNRRVVFEAEEDQMDALFGEGQRPSSFENRGFADILSGNATFSGNIGEMEGDGSFEDHISRVKILALDSGVLPEWASRSPEVMDILYIAQAEGKSQQWVLEQISGTASFRQRFPNIDALGTHLSISDRVRGFLEFEHGVTQSILSIGGQGNVAVTPGMIGGLLVKGHSLQTIQTAVGRFDRMQNYAPAIEAFNRILIENGKPPIESLQDMFDFVSGNAPSDVYEMWEASSISEAAAQAGLADVFTAEDAMNYAVQTEGQTSLADATQGFQAAANMLLRMRHQVDVGQFGIEQDDIIDLSIGQPLRSGVSAADISVKLNKAILQAQQNLSRKGQSFKELGTSKQESLSSLRESS
jgi:hypothetical protein